MVKNRFIIKYFSFTNLFVYLFWVNFNDYATQNQKFRSNVIELKLYQSCQKETEKVLNKVEK